MDFIPPYSPDLDPVEELFSKVKACLKENDEAIQAADGSAVVDFVHDAFSTATPDDCYAWFKHAGLSTETTLMQSNKIVKSYPFI